MQMRFLIKNVSCHFSSLKIRPHTYTERERERESFDSFEELMTGYQMLSTQAKIMTTTNYI